MRQARKWHLVKNLRKKGVVTLAEAFDAGLVEPGQPVRVVIGKAVASRPDPRSSCLCEGLVEEVDMVNSTITVSISEVSNRVISRNARVRLAFAAPQGLYTCAGPVKAAAVNEGSLRLTIQVSGMNWIQEREHTRVRIPGARATCRTPFRSVDCPVVDISPKGMRVKGLGEIQAGTEVAIRLSVPLLPVTELVGRVVWTESDPFGVTQSGIQFTQMPPQFRDHLVGLCLLFQAFFN